MTEKNWTPLRRRRMECGWTQDELGELCRKHGARGLNQSEISKLERGARAPSAKVYRVLTETLGVSGETLWPSQETQP